MNNLPVLTVTYHFPQHKVEYVRHPDLNCWAIWVNGRLITYGNIEPTMLIAIDDLRCYIKDGRMNYATPYQK